MGLRVETYLRRVLGFLLRVCGFGIGVLECQSPRVESCKKTLVKELASHRQQNRQWQGVATMLAAASDNKVKFLRVLAAISSARRRRRSQ